MRCRVVSGGLAKGDRPAVLGSMGELTDVASAKRAALGVLTESPDEELDVLGRTVTWLLLILSSVSVRCGSGRFDSGSIGDTGS